MNVKWKCGEHCGFDITACHNAPFEIDYRDLLAQETPWNEGGPTWAELFKNSELIKLGYSPIALIGLSYTYGNGHGLLALHRALTAKYKDQKNARFTIRVERWFKQLL